MEKKLLSLLNRFDHFRKLGMEVILPEQNLKKGRHLHS